MKPDAEEDIMKTVIIGPGGVGLALGSCLHFSRNPVCFVGRKSQTTHPLETEGLYRTGMFGEVFVAPDALEFYSEIESLSGTAPDYILICTKADALDEVGSALRSIWGSLESEPKVVLCQNGWGHFERMARYVPSLQIYNARIITGFNRLSANRVEITVHADSIHVGSLAGGSIERITDLTEAIQSGGIPCRGSSEIEADLLAKLLYNCLLNPLGALVGVPYGVLGERSETRFLMQGIAREIFSVLEASGRSTQWSNADQYLSFFYEELLPMTAEHRSSMLQDLNVGRTTEIESLNGAIVRMGARSRVATPINQAIRTLIHTAESRTVQNSKPE